MLFKSFISLLAIADFVTVTLAAPATIAKVINAGEESTIDGEYIVVYKSGVSDAAVEAHTKYITSFNAKIATEPKEDGKGGKRGFGNKRFKSMKKFNVATFKLNKDSLAEVLKSSDVAYVEQNARVTINVDAKLNKRAYRADSTWGLDRISHTISTDPWSYYYNSAAELTGGISVYVLDTGIRTTHVEFGDYNTGATRAFWGTNTVDNYDSDGNGHGTHCAGTIGALTYGVNRKVNLWAVKVLDADGDGTTASVLDGMDWVAATATPNLSVASMSLGAGKSTTLNNAVDALYNMGITVVVAAGNDGSNAKNFSPASAPNALTIGALEAVTGNNNQITFKMASFSNYGTAVDVLAPGVNVLSTWADSDNATASLSGTSMATPFVAGLAAYFIGMVGQSGLSPADVAAEIIGTAVTGQITGNLKNSPNKIAFNGYCTPGAGCST
ncbi:Oryzin [Dactylellina cionopaga]|nr:Oryzin [Dactylellina cionopaga]